MAGADADFVEKLRKDLETAQADLDKVAGEESTIKQKLDALDVEDDSDDELFGDNDDKVEVSSNSTMLAMECVLTLFLTLGSTKGARFFEGAS